MKFTILEGVLGLGLDEAQEASGNTGRARPNGRAAAINFAACHFKTAWAQMREREIKRCLGLWGGGACVGGKRCVWGSGGQAGKGDGRGDRVWDLRWRKDVILMGHRIP